MLTFTFTDTAPIGSGRLEDAVRFQHQEVSYNPRYFTSDCTPASAHVLPGGYMEYSPYGAWRIGTDSILSDLLRQIRFVFTLKQYNVPGSGSLPVFANDMFYPYTSSIIRPNSFGSCELRTRHPDFAPTGVPTVAPPTDVPSTTTALPPTAAPSMADAPSAHVSDVSTTSATSLPVTPAIVPSPAAPTQDGNTAQQSQGATESTYNTTILIGVAIGVCGLIAVAVIVSRRPNPPQGQVVVVHDGHGQNPAQGQGLVAQQGGPAHNHYYPERADRGNVVDNQAFVDPRVPQRPQSRQQSRQRLVNPQYVPT